MSLKETADTPYLPLDKWQAELAPTITNPFVRRLLHEYPAWLLTQPVAWQVGPRKDCALVVLYRTQRIQVCHFNKRQPLSVRLHHLWPEDVTALRGRLSNPANLGERNSDRPGFGGLRPAQFSIETEDDYRLLQEMTRRQIGRIPDLEQAILAKSNRTNEQSRSSAHERTGRTK